MKKGFTLAEVLITLGIIGIVAAMTMPTLIQKNEERITVTKVKKFYSVMNQALLMAIKDNGYVDEWDYESRDSETGEKRADKFVGYFKKYLKLSKDCGDSSDCIPYIVYKLLNGTNHRDYGTKKDYYKMILADGSYMWVRTTLDSNFSCNTSDSGVQNSCGAIWFDVNGPKPPNTIGKDTFQFQIVKNAVVPAKINDCNAVDSGWGCASYILQHGDMKYLHK